MTPKNFGQREIKLFRLYCRCKFGMTPQEFYARWDVTHAQIAQICGVSEPTVNRWFSQSRIRRSSGATHRKKLAEMNLIWEEYERIPHRLVRKSVFFYRRSQRQQSWATAAPQKHPRHLQSHRSSGNRAGSL